MNDYFINAYYHSIDDKVYLGIQKYKSRYEADCFHKLFRNAFKPRPILAYRIHVKMKPIYIQSYGRGKRYDFENTFKYIK